ncbi:DNA-3-methyladenine glycosylase [Planococcus shenhongbingii]|uniref:DNA-3-methyladenine glycosylase 2 n=1 Tax=Planococcus shenhongbingii TaxID=3058398 RepID=UPI00260BDBD2|nr:DNA-3-methyladenine glycosylase [Planococcus sp. N016]WKA59187.1 DNA-3-methyladenine glycosylase [Planococcus sp. N016]
MATQKELLIELPEIFDFSINLAYMQRNPKECMYAVKEGTIMRALDVGGVRTLFQITCPDNRFLHVHFLTGIKPENKNAIAAFIRNWFDLDNDPTLFYEMAQKDPLLKQTVSDFYGLRNIGFPDLFEALCWGILGQQINLGYAYTLKRQFVEKFGESVEYNGQAYWIFPSYEEIAKLQPADLSDIKMTMKKSEYIIGVAQLMANGALSKEKLMALGDFKQIEKELIKIRGIGPWTANYVLMRCLRFPTAFPIDDVGLINALKLQMALDRKPTKQEILNAAVSWKDWEAYATFYLWRLLY